MKGVERPRSLFNHQNTYCSNISAVSTIRQLSKKPTISAVSTIRQSLEYVSPDTSAILIRPLESMIETRRCGDRRSSNREASRSLSLPQADCNILYGSIGITSHQTSHVLFFLQLSRRYCLCCYRGSYRRKTLDIFNKNTKIVRFIQSSTKPNVV